MEGIGRDELLGADVALSSKKLLNVAARGIENGGEVCGGHLDWTFSMRFTRRKSVKERRGGGGSFRRRGCCSLAELCDFGTQNQFCGVPREGCAVNEVLVPIKLLFGGPLRNRCKKGWVVYFERTCGPCAARTPKFLAGLLRDRCSGMWGFEIEEAVGHNRASVV